MKLHLVALRHGPCLMGSQGYQPPTRYTRKVIYIRNLQHPCLLIATHFTDTQKDDSLCQARECSGVEPGPLASEVSMHGSVYKVCAAPILRENYWGSFTSLPASHFSIHRLPCPLSPSIPSSSSSCYLSFQSPLWRTGDWVWGGMVLGRGGVRVGEACRNGAKCHFGVYSEKAAKQLVYRHYDCSSL